MSVSPGQRAAKYRSAGSLHHSESSEDGDSISGHAFPSASMPSSPSRGLSPAMDLNQRMSRRQRRLSQVCTCATQCSSGNSKIAIVKPCCNLLLCVDMFILCCLLRSFCDQSRSSCWLQIIRTNTCLLLTRRKLVEFSTFTVPMLATLVVVCGRLSWDLVVWRHMRSWNNSARWEVFTHECGSDCQILQITCACVSWCSACPDEIRPWEWPQCEQVYHSVLSASVPTPLQAILFASLLSFQGTYATVFKARST